MNPTTYPNFLRFLKLFPPKTCNDEDPGIPVVNTAMTFSVSRDGGVLEWAGKNLATVFCQPWRILDPGMWRMIYDIFRFNVCSRRFLQKPPNIDREMSIGEYLKQENYSSSFANNYLIVSHLTFTVRPVLPILRQSQWRLQFGIHHQETAFLTLLSGLWYFFFHNNCYFLVPTIDLHHRSSFCITIISSRL